MAAMGLCSTSECRKKCKRNSTKSTPLPKAKIFVVLSVAFGNVFGQVVLFPFLPFMVQDFFPHLGKEELGQQAGYLGSAYFIGSFAGSMAWGWVSDIWGRRPALLVGSTGIILASLLFGFSQTFTVAVFGRFFGGLLNGNIGIAKTYLSEILDDSNQAKGFSILGIASGLGRVFGSVVGGFLSQPASKYSFFENDFFCTYQYVLPIFVSITITGIGFLGVFLVLKETLRAKKHDNSDQDENNSTDTNVEMIVLDNNNNNEDSTIVDISTDDDGDETIFSESDAESDLSDLLNNEHIHSSHNYEESYSKFRSISYVNRYYHFQKDQCIECCHPCLSIKQRDKTLSSKVMLHSIKKFVTLRLRLLWDRRVILTIITYGFVGGVTILSNEIYPLILVTDHARGGYSMDDNEIAMFIMIAGVALLIYQVFLYSKIAKITGYRHLMRISLIVFALGNFLLPFANQITGPIDDEEMVSGSGMESVSNGSDNGYCVFNYTRDFVNKNSLKRLPASVWAIMILITLMIVLGRVSALVTMVVLVNNSAVTQTRGTVNGIAQSTLAIFRSWTPAVGSIVFAWSEKNSLNWPLNFHLTFEVTVLISISIVIFSFCFPKSTEKKRTE